MSVSVCVCVCVSVCVGSSVRDYIFGTSRMFCHAVARSCSDGVVIRCVLPVLRTTSFFCSWAKVARRRRPSADAQCTRSLGLGYKLCTVKPVAGQRTRGTTFRALRGGTFLVATAAGAESAVYDWTGFVCEVGGGR